MELHKLTMVLHELIMELHISIMELHNYGVQMALRDHLSNSNWLH